MTEKINSNFKQVVAMVTGVVLLLVVFLVFAPQPASAAVGECSALPSDKGLATHNEPGVGSGNYTVFARVKVATGAATFDLSIDGAGGGLCDYQVTKSGSGGQWVWYSSGNTKLSWTGGDMRFQMSGDKNGVGLDCVVLFDLSQGAFNPTTKEDCNPTDPGDPGTPGGETSGCTPVSLGVVGPVVASFLQRTIVGNAATYDSNSNGKIDLGEVSPLVSKFLQQQCL